MDITCEKGTVIPINNALIKCGKGISSSDCVIFEEAQLYLNLPTNSTTTEVVVKMLELLIDTRNRLSILENV